MSSSSVEAPESTVQVASKTDVGRVREANEDSCDAFELSHGAHLLVLADGMGGHRGGATASRTAIEAISESFTAAEEGSAADVLEKAIVAANERVWELAQGDPDLEGMGTTVVAFHLDERRRATVAHVGDSRAYRFRKGRLEPLTSDHSVVAEMQRRGLLSADEAAVHPRRNEILRSVGVLPEVDVEVADVEVRGGDRYVLCSDGLSGVVTDDEIAGVVQANPPSDAVDALIDLANERGGPDNITVQILAVPAGDTEGDPEATAPVELSSVGIEAVENRRRQRRRAKQVGTVVLVAGTVVAAWLIWQTASRPTRPAERPDPAPETAAPRTVEPATPEDRFEVEAPAPRKGIPRDGDSR